MAAHVSASVNLAMPVHPPTAAYPTLAQAKGLIQQRHILEHPAIESGVVDLPAAFFHHLLELSIAYRIRHIPAHTPEDDLSLKMTAFEIDLCEVPATKPPGIIGAAGKRAKVCDSTCSDPRQKRR